MKLIINLSVLFIVIAFGVYVATSLGKEEVKLADGQDEAPFNTAYRKATLPVYPEGINQFDLHGGLLFVSSGDSVHIADTGGKRQASFSVKPGARDIMADGDDIYILYSSLIEVYNKEGVRTRMWEACSDLSDYCSFCLAGGFVFVTDAENKNICKYTKEGNFARFIQSPGGFIIPSYSFDIEARGDTLYCVNSGRHKIETYTLGGDYIASFGKAGAEAGSFAGCCNPAYITLTPGGDILASEKGVPRVSSFRRDGTLKEVMLNKSYLGGGTKAYGIKTDGKQFFVAGEKTITIYTYKNES